MRRMQDPTVTEHEEQALSPEPREAPHAILALQRSAGNAAVARAIRGGAILARETPGQMAEQGALALAGGGVSLALTALAVKNKAWVNAMEHTNSVGNHLGPTDACRHCGWAGMIMLAALNEDRFSLLPSVFGSPEEQTWKVVMAHETAVGGANTKDSKMDQHNNRAGIQMAKRLFDANKDVSRDDVAMEARQELDRGTLMLFDKTGAMVRSGDWRTMDPETWEIGKYLDAGANPVPQPPPATP